MDYNKKSPRNMECSKNIDPLTDGEPETVKPKNRFLASVKNRKTGSWTEPKKNGEPVF